MAYSQDADHQIVDQASDLPEYTDSWIKYQMRHIEAFLAVADIEVRKEKMRGKFQQIVFVF